MPDSVINFYNQHEYPYGVFSNFSPHHIYLNGCKWPTTEHYFQAMKFHPHSPKDVKEVQCMSSAGKAAGAGRDRSRPLHKNWEGIKDNVMFDACYAKFTQHKDLKALLLGTGDATLVEHTFKDSYWGDGGDGSGKNMLGITLMQVRAKIKAEAEGAVDAPTTSSSEVSSTSVPIPPDSTATSWNRKRDKKRLESQMGVPEFPPPPPANAEALLQEQSTIGGGGGGSSSSSASSSTHQHPFLYRFIAITSSTSAPVILATGYNRIVYGDHGPYVEFDKDHICWDHFPTMNEEKAAKATQRYYDEWFAIANNVKGQPIMLYEQLRDVKGKAHPPRDGKVGAVFRQGSGATANDNDSAEQQQQTVDGYADYQPGCYYLDPEDLKAIPPSLGATSGGKGSSSSSGSPAATATAAKSSGVASGTGKADAAKKKKKNRLQ